MSDFDDPTLPVMALDPQPFRDWQDFFNKVVVPIVEGSEDDLRSHDVQEAMRLFRQCSPYYLCICMFFAARSTPFLGASQYPMR